MEKNSLYQFDLEKGNNIVGVDEVGRGPLAGPVVAAAARIKKYSDELQEINDSKKLTEKKREKLFGIINECFDVGVGMASVEEIDEINILNATFLAMRRAIEKLEIPEDEEVLFLVDGNSKIREFSRNQETVVKGDAKSLAIAAASIIAKVTRDRMMVEEASKYPEYSFEKHKGYGTKAHREAILTHGVLDIHRKSFLTKILASDGK